MILTNGSRGGKLVVEIRNALADAIGVGAHPPLRTVALRVPPSPDYAGRYRLDAAVPMDLRRGLADSFEYDSIQVRIAGDAVELVRRGQDKPMPLRPLGPAQFVYDGLYMYVFDFRRDAWGKVRGVTVSIPEADSVTITPASDSAPRAEEDVPRKPFLSRPWARGPEPAPASRPCSGPRQSTTRPPIAS